MILALILRPLLIDQQPIKDDIDQHARRRCCDEPCRERSSSSCYEGPRGDGGRREGHGGGEGDNVRGGGAGGGKARRVPAGRDQEADQELPEPVPHLRDIQGGRRGGGGRGRHGHPDRVPDGRAARGPHRAGRLQQRGQPQGDGGCQGPALPLHKSLPPAVRVRHGLHRRSRRPQCCASP